MRIWFLYLAFLCALNPGKDCYAQDPYYTVINKGNGLPSNSVYDLFQDSKGFIWIANNEGLTRYDGFEFKTYSNAKQTSRSGNGIEEDKFGRIWYKNFDGYLYYVENDSLKSLKQHPAPGNAGYAIIGDRLLLLQANGLTILDLKTLKNVSNLRLNLSKFISDLHYKDHFYISTADSLYQVSGTGQINTYPLMHSGMMAGSKNGILFANKNIIEKAFYEVHGSNSVLKITPSGIKYIHAVDYCDGLYWMFSPNGVWVYNEAGNNINNNQPFFASKSVSSVLKDKEGNYWLGTLDNGILFVPDLNVKLIAYEGFSPNVLTTFGGLTYIGTKDNIIYTYDQSSNNLQKKYTGPVRHEILTLTDDSVNKQFLFSAENFIITDRNFGSARSLLISVKDITRINDKYCAFTGTGNAGLLKLNDNGNDRWDSLFNATQNSACKEASEFMTAIRGKTIAYNAVSGTIYAGSNKGLYAVTPVNTTEIKAGDESIYARKLVSYCGKVYVLTSQHGLYAIDQTNKLSPLPLPDGAGAPIKIKCAGNNFYLLTTTGLRILDTLTGTFKIRSLHPGIRSEEVNDLEEINNKLVIASDRGLVVIDRTNSFADSIRPGFTINAILVNGNKVTGNKLLSLSHKENDIDINYSVLSFSTDRRYQLYYRINDGKWQLTSGNVRDLKLASLSPGGYNISFELRADNGKIYPQPAIEFIIKKPIWTEWWFLGGCLILLTASGYTYYKWQTNILKEQNALMLEKVELEKNLRNSMLTSIRAQMNPHFFYNALNAIQSFIFSDDKRNASTYLVKLSRLTRMILEMSEKESITLDEETDALKLYLELEKMRFSDDFQFEVFTAENVDTELVKIPPMIVQPYVENAIKHGLLHRKGHKHLSIQFRKDNGTLCITIDDNGIGRTKANELNQIRKDKHDPFATKANSRRIDLLNKERNKDIGVVYIDKKDEHGNATGTTVVISIPLI